MKNGRYLTTDDILRRIEELETGEIPPDAIEVPEFNMGNPSTYYGLFPEALCEHGVRRELCYPCMPLIELPEMYRAAVLAAIPRQERERKRKAGLYHRPIWERRDSRYDD